MFSLKGSFIYLFISLISLCVSPSVAQTVNDMSGRWRGEFLIRDSIKAPFVFEIRDSGNVIFVNGEERFDAGQLKRIGDSLFIPLDQFDNELALGINGKHLIGFLRRQDLTGVPTPVAAQKGNKERFEIKTKPFKDVSGTYEVEFEYESGKKEKAVALFEHKGKKLTATFLKPSGDTRFLEGVVDGNRFFLSSFIGSSPGYYEGEITNEGMITGFQAGTRVKNHFAGKYNPSATLADPYAVSSIAAGEKTIRFSLPDINGKTVSLQDEKYKNKVVILAITGTWCPNCIDEAAFLSPWYKKNKDRGIEIITIHFERQSDTGFVNKVMGRFRKRFDITYDQVFGGIANADSVAAALKGLESFKSFPTTIFIDKKGNVSKIHAGYTGPATGKFYDDFVKEFNDEVDHLLKESS